MNNKQLSAAISEVLQSVWVAQNITSGTRIPIVYGAEDQGIDVAH